VARDMGVSRGKSSLVCALLKSPTLALFDPIAVYGALLKSVTLALFELSFYCDSYNTVL
jgi:hypothetical protein